jgi:hypothetical protein
MPSFFHVASTYWKHTSVTSLIDIPLVSVLTFLEGMLASPGFGQVGGSFGSNGALSSPQTLGPTPRDLMFAFVRAQKDFLSRIPMHPMRLHRRHTSLPLCLHVDRGLVRHGYPWVPTDQGPRGPYQVDPTWQKPCRPASGPGDLIHNPDDPGRPWTTLSRLQTTCWACAPSFSLDHGGDTPSRPEDHGILSVIMEGDLPKSVTDPDEGPSTSNGNPSPPNI